tara:strand:+ start:746 stop:895 length:150 start_codon:yes stop_codon:yes gene_type:complete
VEVVPVRLEEQQHMAVEQDPVMMGQPILVGAVLVLGQHLLHKAVMVVLE